MSHLSKEIILTAALTLLAVILAACIVINPVPQATPVPQVITVPVPGPIITVVAPGAPQPSSKCNWVDGQDPKGPVGDTGRGDSVWANHYNIVMNTPGTMDVSGYLASRMSALRQCLTKTNYAKVYADVSVVLAKYGRENCGWVDGQDPRGPFGDMGRGDSVWANHYNLIVNTPGAIDVSGYFASRTSALRECLTKTDYAKTYADVSVILAKYGREN